MLKQKELFEAILLYVKLQGKCMDSIKFKSYSFLRFRDLFHVAPELMCQQESRYKEGEKFYDVTKYFDDLKSGLADQVAALKKELGLKDLIHYAETWLTVINLLHGMEKTTDPTLCQKEIDAGI